MSRTRIQVLARGLAASGRRAWQHRRGLNAWGTRALWAGSLWLLVDAGSALLDVSRPLEVASTGTRFGLGLGACWLVVVLAPQPRLRTAATALGTAHGALGLLLWTLVAGALTAR